MVIAGRVKRIGFYCRMNRSDSDAQFWDGIRRSMEKSYGKKDCELKIMIEKTTGTDPDRKQT